jgi:hypothetical protein
MVSGPAVGHSFYGVPQKSKRKEKWKKRKRKGRRKGMIG